MPLYVGFDASTQSLTAIAIEVSGDARRVAWDYTLNFDAELPWYGTRHGVLPAAGPLTATAPPLMWAEALDVMMREIARSGLPLAAIEGFAGSAQQHGSVYLARGAGDALAALDAARPLRDQIAHVFSRAESPIWMDASTGRECAAITDLVGGPSAVARLTGSRAFERFTGPQIRKFAADQPGAYARTERIHLVSSFMASLLAGAHAPVDRADASGMNLMNIRSGQWAPEALRATAAGLDSKLPEIRPSASVIAPLGAYWRQRYGFAETATVVWSGDNPCSLVGVGLVHDGDVAISLGTSDTVFGVMRDARVDPSGTGRVFGAPTGEYMGLTCFQNGSLAREHIRDQFALDWAGFSRALQQTRPGNGGALMLPWVASEITPPVHTPGVRRFDLDPANVAANVRAVVEGQMLSMARHSRWMGVKAETIVATGGAAINREILQIMADVFGAEICPMRVGNSAALGAALRARHAIETRRDPSIGWDTITEGFVRPLQESRVRPDADTQLVYARLAERYAACEALALQAAG
jgi:xylulokinase